MMETDFKSYIEANKLVNKGDRVLLAVSGGIDSMVMAELFRVTGIEYGIAHCNFSLRGRESDKDEELVKNLAARNKVPFYVKKFNTKKFAAENGISIQMAARDLRYKWFEEIRRKNEFDSIAVAHNLNDKIETLLINLVRGTGIAGLSGMKAAGNKIIRPLLFATRDRISEYCFANRINYREDKSNSETKYTRNKIRHLVIPVLKEINPSVEFTLNDTAGRMNDANEIVMSYCDGVRKKILKKENDDCIIEINELKPYLNNKTILFELFQPFGITGSNLNDLYAIIKGATGGYIFTGTHRIIKNRKEILITGSLLADKTFYKARNLAELKKLPCFRTVERSKMTGNLLLPHDPSTATLDFNKVEFPVYIRNWLTGDYFYPFGMKGRKKLSDYFTDRKFSKLRKEKALIMESSGEIIWLLGERIDDRFKVTGTTEEVLILKVPAAGSLFKDNS